MKTLLEKYASRMSFYRAPEGEGNGADVSIGGQSVQAQTALGVDAEVVQPPASATDTLYPNEPVKTDAEPEKKPDPVVEPAKVEKVEPEKKPEAVEWKEYVKDEAKTDEENAAAKAEHDKTKPAEEKKDDKDKKAETVALTADQIDLTPPEGFDLDEEVGGEFKKFAIDNGLTLDQVNTLKGMQVKLYEKQTASHAEKVAEWGESLKTNKEIGGAKLAENLGGARAVIRDFFPPEAKALMDATGLGNHPDLVVGFVRMHKAMGEGRTITGGNTTRTSTIVDAMYGEGDG